MKKITFLFTLIFSTTLTFAQVVLSEDFEGGTVIPTASGWTNDDILGNGDTWAIESSGEAALAGAGNTLVFTAGGAVGNYASFNSDGSSNNGLPEEVALVSPVFSCVGLTQVTLQYNYLFAGNFGGSGFVEVSSNGGLTWTTIDTYTADGYDGGTVTSDVSAQLAGQANSQVRFRWTGDFSVAFYVDNVSVFQCTVNQPNAVTSAISPANGATNVDINYGATTNNIGPFEWNPGAGGDPADSFNISLGTDPAGTNIGTISGFPSGNSINFNWQPNTTYFWFIQAVNCDGATDGTVFSFTTSACTDIAPPSAVTTPVPADGATGVTINADGNALDFSWNSVDPGANFTLNLGTTNPPTQAFDNFANGGTITGLAENTTYFWSVDPINCFGATTGAVWTFTTGLALSVTQEEAVIFRAYPNPTGDILNIKGANEIDNVSVFNLLGQNVKSFGKADIVNSSISLADLSDGLYIVRISVGDKTQTIRVTKK